MDKVKLNNQIVLMRKYVKQAKVHVINKLVKQAKLLQNRKGNEVQMQKAKRKAERFLEIIVLLKKIKPDYVSKLALSKAKNWKDILQQKNSTLDDRCVAMLASYGAVQKEVESFHSSNKNIVLKIPDYIKMWDEKEKTPKNSSKEKIVSGKIKKDKKPKKLSTKANGNVLNNKNSETCAVKLDNQVASEEDEMGENILMNDSCNESNKQFELSIQSPENAVSDTLHKVISNDSSVENRIEIKHSNSNFLKNITGSKESNNFGSLEENTMESENSDTSEESELDDKSVENMAKLERTNFKPAKNAIEVRHSQNDEDHEESELETRDLDTDEESNHDDSGTASDVLECNTEDIKIHKNDTTKLQESTASEMIKKADHVKSSSENKLKAIAVFNLDELEGWDEIPVSNPVEIDQTDESEDSSEDETVESSQNNRNDPFFLGRGGEDSITENKSSAFPNNNDNISDDKRSQKESNSFSERKRNSEEYNHKRKFQKFSGATQSFRRDSSKFQNERNNLKPFQKNKFKEGFSKFQNKRDDFKPFQKNKFSRDTSKFRNRRDGFESFQKDKFVPRKYQEKFQPKNKSPFERNDIKNQRDFKMKGKSPHNYKEKKISEDHSKKSESQFPVKNPELHKKNNANDKPLHPSWEAKRKQKELVNTSFQGKRIVFDD